MLYISPLSSSLRTSTKNIWTVFVGLTERLSQAPDTNLMDFEYCELLQECVYAVPPRIIEDPAARFQAALTSSDAELTVRVRDGAVPSALTWTVGRSNSHCKYGGSVV